MKLTRLCVAFAVVSIAAAVMPASAASTPQGPVYPPAGGVTLGRVGVDSGVAGGRTFKFSNFAMGNFRSLWWGQSGVASIKLSFDGAADSDTETLQFSAADSNLGGGIAVFTGSSTLGVRTGSAITYETIPTRMTVTATRAGGAAPMVTSASTGLPAATGGIAVVTGDFDANLLFEGYRGGSWTPARTLYDSVQHVDNVSRYLSSFNGGFYFIANQLPTASFTADARPVENKPFTLTSTSSDPDGSIVATEWDLNNDGYYDDASGTSVQVSRPAGTYSFGLRVTDDNGGIATASASVLVHRCDEGQVSDMLHSTVESNLTDPPSGALHQANCTVLGANGL